MKKFFALVAVVATTVIVACTPASAPSADGGSTPIAVGPVIEAGGQIADGVCKLVEGVDDNGTVRSVCAGVEDIAQLVGFISTLRATPAFAATRDAGAVACEFLPGTTFCATSAERAKAILHLSRVRAARLLVDGRGVR